jgi:phasin family protein
MGFAEDNVTASLDFAQKLMSARDPQEVVRLQAEFAQAQMKALAEQAKALGDSAAETGKAAFDAAKPSL